MTKVLHMGPDLSETQLNENYEYFLEFIKTSFTGDRQEKLLAMYANDQLGLQLGISPASTKSNFHYAWPGGYLLHVLNVEKASRGIQNVFKAMGGTIDWTDEERVFSALHHDLGKLGDTEFGPYYVPQMDEWRLKKLGEIYSVDKSMPPWDVTDRALYLLQKFGIKLTWKETFAIKLSDGMFSAKNETYYRSFEGLKTNLSNVIHWADWMSCRAEKCQWEAQNAK